MDNVEIMGGLLNDLGVATRTFEVEYQDRRGNYYNAVCVCTADPPINDGEVVQGIIKDYKRKKFEVTAVFEFLHGYSKDEMKKLIATKPKEAAKHTRILYLVPAHD